MANMKPHDKAAAEAVHCTNDVDTLFQLDRQGTAQYMANVFAVEGDDRKISGVAR